MRVSHAVLVAAMFWSTSLLCAAQSSGNAVPPPAAPPAPLAPSAILQPSLDTVRQTLNALRMEKWKKGTVRDEAIENSNAILRDMQTNLPPLIQAADTAHGTISAVLPVSRHVNALYDVLLRVVEAARVSAPSEQITQLEQTLLNLERARRTLDDSLQQTASAQEKQLSDLRTTVRAQAAVRCPAVPPPVTPTCATTPHRRVVRKKAKPPAGTPQTSPAPANTTPKTGK